MTEQELRAKIGELEQAAQALDEPDRTFKCNDVGRLKIKLQGMALSEIAAKMQAIPLPDIKAMDAGITAAKDATAAHSVRVDAVNTVCSLIRRCLGLVLG